MGRDGKPDLVSKEGWNGHELGGKTSPGLPRTNDRSSSESDWRVALFCVDQVQYLAGLHERYWGRLDEARREAVRLRTERRLREAMEAQQVQASSGTILN